MVKVILIIIIAVSVHIIYDARSVANKYFSRENINKQVKMLKIVGFLLAIICSIILYFCIRR